MGGSGEEREREWGVVRKRVGDSGDSGEELIINVYKKA